MCPSPKWREWRHRVGLDNYASRSPDELTLTRDDEEAFEQAALQLCGGIFSGDATSFRGKVYWELVLEVTGESLLDPWLPPVTVRRMSRALSQHTPAELADINDELSPSRRGRTETSPAEMADLQRFFAICAERGIGIVGWA
jgi:hypothetical protein